MASPIPELSPNRPPGSTASSGPERGLGRRFPRRLGWVHAANLIAAALLFVLSSFELGGYALEHPARNVEAARTWETLLFGLIALGAVAALAFGALGRKWGGARVLAIGLLVVYWPALVVLLQLIFAIKFDTSPLSAL